MLPDLTFPEAFSTGIIACLPQDRPGGAHAPFPGLPAHQSLHAPYKAVIANCEFPREWKGRPYCGELNELWMVWTRFEPEHKGPGEARSPDP